MFVIKFLGIMLIVFVIAICGEMLSQLTYHHRSLREIKNDFPRTMRRIFVWVCVFAISSLVWHYIGWKTDSSF